MKRSALWLACALVALAGCGGTRPGHTIADVRGDAIQPVDKAPPEGTLSPPATATQPEQFTLRRRAGAPIRRDTVVRVDPPPRAVTMPDSVAIARSRAATMTPSAASTKATGAAKAPGASPPSPSQVPGTKSPAQAAPSAGDTAASGQFLAQDPPQVISRVPAVSPPRAREERIGGTVLVKVLVGVDGLVRGTRIARSIPELDSAAVACVKQWKFKPAMSSGVPVAAWIDVPVRFLLQ